MHSGPQGNSDFCVQRADRTSVNSHSSHSHSAPLFRLPHSVCGSFHFWFLHQRPVRLFPWLLLRRHELPLLVGFLFLLLSCLNNYFLCLGFMSLVVCVKMAGAWPSFRCLLWMIHSSSGVSQSGSRFPLLLFFVPFHCFCSIRTSVCSPFSYLLVGSASFRGERERFGHFSCQIHCSCGVTEFLLREVLSKAYHCAKARDSCW